MKLFPLPRAIRFGQLSGVGSYRLVGVPAGWQTSREYPYPQPTRQEHASRLASATRDLISTLVCGVRRHSSSAVVGSEIKGGWRGGRMCL